MSYETAVAGSWAPWKPKDPTTKKEADELRGHIMSLPRGFLAKLYLDIHNQGVRIHHDQAKREADAYYGGLK